MLSIMNHKCRIFKSEVILENHVCLPPSPPTNENVPDSNILITLNFRLFTMVTIWKFSTHFWRGQFYRTNGLNVLTLSWERAMQTAIFTGPSLVMCMHIITFVFIKSKYLYKLYCKGFSILNMIPILINTCSIY